MDAIGLKRAGTAFYFSLQQSLPQVLPASLQQVAQVLPLSAQHFLQASPAKAELEMAARAMRDRMVFIFLEMFIGFELSGLTLRH